MENSEVEKPGSISMRTLFKSWFSWKPVLGFVIGALAGYLYFHFVGCESGTCAITGSPYMSTLWGGMMGFFVVNSPCSKGKC